MIQENAQVNSINGNSVPPAQLPSMLGMFVREKIAPSRPYFCIKDTAGKVDVVSIKSCVFPYVERLLCRYSGLYASLFDALYIDDATADRIIDDVLRIGATADQARSIAAMCIAISQRRLKEQAAKFKTETANLREQHATQVISIRSMQKAEIKSAEILRGVQDERAHALNSLATERQEHANTKKALEVELTAHYFTRDFLKDARFHIGKLNEELYMARICAPINYAWSVLQAPPQPKKPAPMWSAWIDEVITTKKPAPAPRQQARIISTDQDDQGTYLTLDIDGKRVNIDIDVEA